MTHPDSDIFASLFRLSHMTRRNRASSVDSYGYLTKIKGLLTSQRAPRDASASGQAQK